MTFASVVRGDFFVAAEFAAPHWLHLRTKSGTNWKFFLGDIDALIDLFANRQPGDPEGLVAVCNVHMFIQTERDPKLAEAINSAAFAVCDGQPIAWLAKLLAGKPVPRVTGPDLFQRILCDNLGKFRVAIVGGNPEILSRIVATADGSHPHNLMVVAPGIVPASGAPELDHINKLKLFRPQITFVGLGCPKQEKWGSQAASMGLGGQVVGVGAALQYFLGDIRVAPSLVRLFGFEWLYRLIQQHKGTCDVIQPVNPSVCVEKIEEHFFKVTQNVR